MESISDVLSSTYTDSELKHVISVLDSESNENAGKFLQRTIRSRTEQTLFGRTESVLSQMRPLAQSLETLGVHIKNSSDVYQEMAKTITHAGSSTAVYAENARYLETETQSLDKQSATLDAYMDAVYISDDEKKIINDASAELSPEFFAILDRMKTIHSQSALLLLAEAPINGEHLMQETSKLLDQAYLRIKSRIDSGLKQKARNLGSDSAPSQLRKYMSLLADRPLLFKAVLQEQSGLRRDQLMRDFNQFIALEQPNASVVPVRYLGSVLAWVHAAIVNEFEYIGLLLDPDTPREEESTAKNKSFEELLSTSDTRKIIVELVDSVIACIEPTLRQRINSAIVAQVDAAVVDELLGVLMFYESMLAKYEQPTLLALFEQLAVSLDRQFTHILGNNYLTWDSRVDVALAIVKTHESGVYSDAKKTQARIDTVLDDVLKSELNDATPIHALNVLDLGISRLAGYIVVQPKLDEFRKLEAEYEAKQVAEEVRNMKQQSKLMELQVGSISAREFLTQFDEYLSVANIDLQERLSLLHSPSIQNRIISNAVLEFTNEYEFAVKEVPNARSAEDVRCLLI